MSFDSSEKWGSLPEEFILEKCIAVNRLNSTALQCQFIRTVADCDDTDGIFNYIELVYCLIGSEYRFFAVLVLVLWLFILFIGLGVTADDFLCPSLLVISKTLRLSQNIAGVTFLAFGNGAPDIFSSLAGIRKARSELVIGELFGSGIFVTSVVAGSILMGNEFKLMKRPLMRDIIFYMFATYITWFIVYKEFIRIEYAIGFIAIYIFYIMVVIIGRVIYTKYRNNNTGNVEHIVSVEYCKSIETSRCRRTSYGSQHSVHNHLSNAIYSVIQEEYSHFCGQRHLSESKSSNIDISEENETTPILRSLKKSGSYLSTTTLLADNVFEKENEWSEFLLHICPLDIKQWDNTTCFGKFIQIVKSPIYFILTVTIPVVDFENSKSNWCRILNSLHIITGPLCIIILTGNLFQMVYNIPVAIIVLVVSTLFAICVILSSGFDEPPPYHWVFGYIGFTVSFIWIYALANEVVDLLQVIGIIFSLSDVILGLTVLAWGNSIGDLVSNISIAKHGFPRMGISACFGGPLMNLLMGIGIPYTFFLSENGSPLKIEYSKMITLLYSTITISLTSTIIIAFTTGFTSKKIHGFFLIFAYLLYLCIACMIEFDII